ncbi:hypothetical protein [Bradyrhizobium sp. SZCCHNS3053]|uniref:hypothetical protein n=1 Tax=Bradyrhizobium sp. SZCCHNS3053 TaxID=3057322 RepID=UPI0029170C6A|nr:hypothetical protein [Bradyrhizobium sp. SZCCHNS3053]
MNPKYLPTELWPQLHRLSEEAGEIVQAIGKAGRFNSLEGAAPDGGPNNATSILSEIADIRHAISVVEEKLIEKAGILVDGTMLVWTEALVTVTELREIIGDEDYATDEDFAAAHKSVPVCEGQWHREGLEYRFYRDPDFDL